MTFLTNLPFAQVIVINFLMIGVGVGVGDGEEVGEADGVTIGTSFCDVVGLGEGDVTGFDVVTGEMVDSVGVGEGNDVTRLAASTLTLPIDSKSDWFPH